MHEHRTPAVLRRPSLGSAAPALGLALACASLLTARAQGTRADYARAAELSQRFDNKVFRDRVQPHWLPDGNRCWYRIRTGAETHEFIGVDALSGERKPAFDHARLADALQQAGLTNIAANRLPLDRLEFATNSNALEFRARGRAWRWTPAAQQLLELTNRVVATGVRRASDLPARSRRTGPDTAITFANRTGADVQLVWLDTEGQKHPYRRLRPGEEYRQHTFGGHAWLALEANTRRPLLGVEAEDEECVVEITEVNTDEAVPVKPAARSGPEPGTSPDGRWRAFVRDHNLWLREIAAGTESALSTDGTADAIYTDAFEWSPDARHLAAFRVRKGGDRKVYLIESSPADQLQPKLDSYDYLKPGDGVPLEQPRLFQIPDRSMLEVATNLFPNPYNLSELRWAADSRSFSFLYNQRGHQALRMIAVDAESAGTRTLVDEQSPTFIDYAGKYYGQFLDRSGELLWMSERDGWNHLYLYDTRSGTVKNQVTRGEWVVRRVVHVDEERRQVWFYAGGIRPGQDPYYLHLARAGFDGTGLTVLTEGDGTHQVEFSPDRRFFVDTWSRVDQAPVTELRRADDGHLLCVLERADVRTLVKAGWRPPQRFVAKGRDGVTDIYGIIHRPMHFQPRHSYPVIEEIYAGPQDSFVPKAFRTGYRAQGLAELGFIVVQIDGMGTSNRSKKFHDVCWKNLGDAGFPDRIAWMRAAAAQEPAMDLRRVGIYGGSAGGQNAARAVLAHGDFYRVAVADCGCHDNRLDKIWWNELWMGWPVGPHYAENSNVTQAHRLQGHLLLIVGELDRNVDPASTMQVVNALVKADKDFDLLVLPGTGHGAAETPYGNRRRMDYFVRHLLGVEPRTR